jgi:hypothetical protein
MSWYDGTIDPVTEAVSGRASGVHWLIAACLVAGSVLGLTMLSRAGPWLAAAAAGRALAVRGER